MVTRDVYRMERETALRPDSTLRHCEDFIECVRSRKRPRANVAIGHRSAIAAHLGNIAYRTGHKIRWDARREEIIDDREGRRRIPFGRMPVPRSPRQLSRENGSRAY